MARPRPGTAGGETHREGDRRRPPQKGDRRPWSCGSTAPAARCWRRSVSARHCSLPRNRNIPVVVSMGSVAASGGYWVSTPGDFIFAEPSTMTGSIGVFGVLPSFQGTLAKLGIGADGIKTTPLSGEPDLLQGPSPEAAADPGRRRSDLSHASWGWLPSRGTRRPPNRPDRAGPGMGRRHRPPARPGRRLRRHGRGNRQGGGARQARRTSAGVRYLEPARAFRDELLEAIAAQGR